MVGARIKEYYAKEAKERQGSNQHKSKVENFPPSEVGKARDMAGKAVGVSGRSIDFASKVQWNPTLNCGILATQTESGTTQENSRHEPRAVRKSH